MALDVGVPSPDALETERLTALGPGAAGAGVASRTVLAHVSINEFRAPACGLFGAVANETLGTILANIVFHVSGRRRVDNNAIACHLQLADRSCISEAEGVVHTFFVESNILAIPVVFRGGAALATTKLFVAAASIGIILSKYRTKMTM